MTKNQSCHSCGGRNLWDGQQPVARDPRLRGDDKEKNKNQKFRFDLISLFPNSLDSLLNTSILKRAQELKKLILVKHNLHASAHNKWQKVDDRPFGGGAGMVLMCQPLFTAIQKIRRNSQKFIPVVYFSPRGQILQQTFIEKFQNKYTRAILVCGHYEGVDQRFIDTLVDYEISLGQFVLTGGEIPAITFIDALVRLIPGVLGKTASVLEESFSAKLKRKIEYPHYTRPANFRGQTVPPVLLSGDHAAIQAWRQKNLR